MTDDVYKANAKELGKIKSGTRKERYKVPVPVVGEAFLKLNDKRDLNVKRNAFKLLENLIARKRIELIAFGRDSTAFGFAKELMDHCNPTHYRQDLLSPMDALIIADAMIDNECLKIYTNDSMMLMDLSLHERVNEIRSNIHPSYPELRFSRL